MKTNMALQAYKIEGNRVVVSGFDEFSYEGDTSAEHIRPWLKEMFEEGFTTWECFERTHCGTGWYPEGSGSYSIEQSMEDFGVEVA